MKKILFFLLLLLTAPASAQVSVPSRDNPPAHGAAQPNLPVELVEKISRSAFDALPQGKTSDGQLIGDRAKDLQYPLVPLDVRQNTIVRGYMAGYANWCGMDWQNKFFLPYMSGVRGANAGWNDFQFAYVGILHGLSMSLAEKSKEGQVCGPADKQKLEEHIQLR